MVQPNDVLQRYRLIERIGAGGMGEVFRAVDEQLGRTVAIKLLPPHRAAPDRQVRLLREAQAASALSHPGIVTLHDIGEHEGRLFLVMEYVQGEKLSDAARRGLTWSEAVSACREAAEALSAAHAAGILHRDVKSDNILRMADGRIKVLDFGIAKLRGELLARVPQPAIPRVASAATVGGAGDAEQATLSMSTDALGETLPATPPARDELTRTGELLGTPAYMAPEQSMTADLDERAEIFSLGVVLYELLVGRRPFDRETVTETLAAIRDHDPESPSRVAPERGIPPAVDAVVVRALAKDPAARFPDMAAFSRELAVLVAPPAPSISPRRRVARTVAGVAVVAGLVGLAAVGLAMRRGRPPALPVAVPSPAVVEVPPAITSAARVTFARGCEENPSLLPSRETVFYDGDDTGDAELMAFDWESERSRTILRNPGDEVAPIVSPDGRHVVYTTTAERIALVLSLAPDAGPPVSLGKVSGQQAWSPDGAVVTGLIDGRVVKLAPDGSGVLAVLGSAPAGTVVHSVAMFPDGDVYAVWRPAVQYSTGILGRILPEGPVPLIDGVTHWARVVASPEADALFFVHKSEQTAEYQLYRLRRPHGIAGLLGAFLHVTTAGEPVEVQGGVTPIGGFDLVHDGHQAKRSPKGDFGLVWSTCRELTYLARLDGADQRPEPLFAKEVWRDTSPVFLDDKTIIFVSNRTSYMRVHQLDLSDGKAVPVMNAESVHPVVSPDRSMIGLVVGWTDDAPGIRVRAAAGGEWRQITDSGDDASPSFTHDGKHLVFQRPTDDGMRLFIVPVEGGTARPISGPGATRPSASPAEDLIAYLHQEPDGVTIMLTDAAGSRHVALRDGLVPSGYRSLRISRDGKRLLTVENRQQAMEFELHSKRPPVTRYKSAEVTFADAIYTPDGKGILAGVSVYEGDLWFGMGNLK